MKTNGIPPELLRSVPRQVHLTRGGYSLAAFAVTLVAGAVASLVLLTWLARQGAERRALVLREGVRAVGEVMEVGRVKDGKRTIRYRYSAPGHLLEGSARFRRRESNGIGVGARIPILYLRSDPELSWRPGHEPRGVPFWAGPAASVVCLIGAAAIWVSFLRQRRLLERGRPALAVVTATRSSQHGQSIRYEFTALNGARRGGSFESRRKLQVGTRIVILYDPDNHRRAAKYPFTLWRTKQM